ncbi:hypothetical protein GLW05_13560 [Pontibacillus yanchengensis]|uniref:Uncharacterized protein n=1 Tax=Pontibacillus yanchengensis TaxID=462910 RepID=A0A6I5A1Q4_9BACI|nr:CBO0543 family protein [Pontibacillus yanchengensis]MYL34620.1 hypothetical protein [Pontibacillus yanchengensis]
MNYYIQKLHELQEISSSTQLQYWKEEVVFTPQWWFLLFSLIFPWFIWWKLFERSIAFNLWIVGLFVMLVSFFLDEVGASYLFWTYPYTLTPLEREVFDPANFTLLPIVYMLLFQYCRSWKLFLIGNVLVSLFNTYIGGGLFRWIGAYELLTWNSYYSIPIYYAIGVATKAFAHLLERIEYNSNSRAP